MRSCKSTLPERVGQPDVVTEHMPARIAVAASLELVGERWALLITGFEMVVATASSTLLVFDV
jgi:hypothetical protein